MKTYFFILLAVIISANSIHSQNTFPIKEHYDKIHSVRIDPFKVYTNTHYTGDVLSWGLSSYIRMYEATKDKAFLVRFINLIIKIQKARQDEFHSGNSSYPPKWTLDSDNDCDKIECTYYNSLLIYPMAEFVNLMVNVQVICNTNFEIRQFIFKWIS
jgi:hypothetical protein